MYFRTAYNGMGKFIAQKTLRFENNCFLKNLFPNFMELDKVIPILFDDLNKLCLIHFIYKRVVFRFRTACILIPSDQVTPSNSIIVFCIFSNDLFIHELRII